MSERQQCGSCAYRAGCATHEDEPQNRLKAEICAVAALPFYCHATTPGWQQMKASKLTAAEAMAQRRAMPICEGWRAQVARNAAEGRYAKGTAPLRRALGTRALQIISEALAADQPAKGRLFDQLQQVLEILVARSGWRKRKEPAA